MLFWLRFGGSAMAIRAQLLLGYDEKVKLCTFMVLFVSSRVSIDV